MPSILSADFRRLGQQVEEVAQARAAQELNLPLSLHILTGRGGNRFSRRKVLFGYMKLPQEIQLTLADMIIGGVFERFPRLKIVSAEHSRPQRRQVVRKRTLRNYHCTREIGKLFRLRS